MMARYVNGPRWSVQHVPAGNVLVGDVIVQGGITLVAGSDDPIGSGLSIIQTSLWIGGIYQMAADAGYANGTFVYWDSVLQQVTAQTGANRTPFGGIVAGPLGLLSDGGPIGAASTCFVLHEPMPELRFGGATPAAGQFSSFNDEGNLYRAIGNPLAGNAADTTDDIVGGIVIAANAFDLSGRGLAIMLAGKFGATADNKRIKLWANPTMAGQTVTNGVISGGTVTGVGTGVLLYDSGVQTGNAVGFNALVNWFKYGANASNTQMYQSQSMYGATHGGCTVPAFSTIPENAPINLVVTGSSPTTGAANDVVLNQIEVNAMN